MRWREAPIPRGSYAPADGHSWAEPDVDHAAQLCRQVAERRQVLVYDLNIADPSRDALVLAEYRNRFCFAEVGVRYRQRLKALLAEHISLGVKIINAYTRRGRTHYIV